MLISSFKVASNILDSTKGDIDNTKEEIMSYLL